MKKADFFGRYWVGDWCIYRGLKSKWIAALIPAQVFSGVPVRTEVFKTRKEAEWFANFGVRK